MVRGTSRAGYAPGSQNDYRTAKVAASWTIGVEEDGCALHRPVCRVSRPDLRTRAGAARRALGGPPQG